MKEMIISNRYHLRSLIGQGGMADVYLAYDDILKRDVAIKILRESLADDPVHVQRFKREASAVAAISHTNVVEIYDVGEENNKYYIVMEYVSGKTLKDLITIRSGLEMEEAVDIISQVVSGLAAAHSQGVIHRDIKPQNILVTDSGIVKISDFGIASIQSYTKLTQGDTIMGSLHYLAPELAKGEEATYQSDIYAVGIMLYEMLTGKVPFNGDSPVNIALKHIREPIPSVREVNPTIYQSVENIVYKATAKDLSDRYQTAEEMMDDLLHYEENKDEPPLVFEEEDDDATIIASPEDLFFSNDTDEEEVDEEELKKEKRKKRLKIIIYAAMAIASILIIIYLMFASGIFNESAKTVKVPEVVGLSLEEAIELVEDEGLEYTTKEKPSDDYEEGLISNVYPSEGKEVDEGSTVTLTVSTGIYIVIEDYVGMDYDTVYNELNTLGFTITTITVEDSSLAANTIVEQSIEAGTKIDPNQENKSIRFKVVASYQYVMGNFYNSDVTSAKSTLESNGLSVVLEVLDPPTDPTEIAVMQINKVVDQSIEVGTVITTRGTEVILYYYDSKPEVVEEDTTSSDTTDDTAGDDTTTDDTTEQDTTVDSSE